MSPKQVSRPRTQVYKNTRTEVHDDSRTQRERERGQAERAVLDRELEDLLDEIDDVLESNAMELVTNFVQQGGQ